MDVRQQLMRFWQADPFKPFRIRTASATYRVQLREHVAFDRRGGPVVVCRGREGFDIIDIDDVTSVGNGHDAN